MALAVAVSIAPGRGDAASVGVDLEGGEIGAAATEAVDGVAAGALPVGSHRIPSGLEALKANPSPQPSTTSIEARPSRPLHGNPAEGVESYADFFCIV
ncbi:MAG: hypothetical protein ACYDC1_11635, partial [Limisphaerales bacterium]